MPEDENPDIVRLDERMKAFMQRVEAVERKIDAMAQKAWWIITIGIAWAAEQLLSLIGKGT